MKIRTLEPRYSRKVRNDKDLLLKGRQKKYCWFWKCQMPMPYFLIFKILSSFWCRVDLQCRISSKCTEKLIHLYIYVYSLFEILFSCRLSQNIRQSSMCYAVGLCYLSILCSGAHVFTPNSWFILPFRISPSVTMFDFAICKSVSVS